MSNTNKILDDNNEPLSIVNLFGTGTLVPTKTLDGLPLGTVNNDPSGEIVLKVSIREGSAGGGGGGGGAATVANGADVAQGSTTDVPVADNTTLASATAATAIALFKRIVNLLIAILAKQPAVTTYATTISRVTSNGSIPSGVASWSITNIDSTNLQVASQAIPAGMSLNGGGYPGRLSTNSLAYTLSNGAAVIVYEI